MPTPATTPADDTSPLTLTSIFADTLPDFCAAAHVEDEPDPQVVIVNDELAAELGLDPQWLASPAGVAFLLGRTPATPKPVALAYAGYQFGQLNPMMGDGRALLLGEATLSDRLVDIHLKGSGPTPYTRRGDGRGALGPMLREFVVSEALHALGVPTSRSLAVISTGRSILRTGPASMPTPSPGALLVRIASSHLRVGTMTLARLRQASGQDAGQGAGQDAHGLRQLADTAIARHYPYLELGDYRGLFRSVMDAQAHTVAQWMRLGFIHGVMNTDNTTLSGETIDYGPCAFMEGFDPDTWFSSIDIQGRYRYGHQPGILGWNLTRLVEAMMPLFADDEEAALPIAQGLIEEFPAIWDRYHTAEQVRALGVDDKTLISEFYDGLRQTKSDVTTAHRALADGDDAQLAAAVGDASWPKRWKAVSPDIEALKRVHPLRIPRNHLLDEALQRAELGGDLGPIRALYEQVTAPFEGEPTPPAPADAAPFVSYCGT